MISSIVTGTLSHSRFSPVLHGFEYKHTMLMIDLAELESGKVMPKLFRYNHWGLLSIKDSQYLDKSSKAINTKIRSILNVGGQGTEIDRCVLLTTPAIFGYSFNPVSFYFGLNSLNQLIKCASEVHNTFGESHVYLLEPVTKGTSSSSLFTHSKQLYVSPFIQRSGQYTFQLSIDDHFVDVQIDLHQDHQKTFTTRFSGSCMPFTNANVVKSFMRIGTTVLMTEIRILLQAYLLFVRKRLIFIRKPDPNPGTESSSAPGFITRIAWFINLFYGNKGRRNN